jgi:hypothetical protein
MSPITSAALALCDAFQAVSERYAKLHKTQATQPAQAIPVGVGKDQTGFKGVVGGLFSALDATDRAAKALETAADEHRVALDDHPALPFAGYLMREAKTLHDMLDPLLGGDRKVDSTWVVGYRERLADAVEKTLSTDEASYFELLRHRATARWARFSEGLTERRYTPPKPEQRSQKFDLSLAASL